MFYKRCQEDHKKNEMTNSILLLTGILIGAPSGILVSNFKTIEKLNSYAETTLQRAAVNQTLNSVM